MHLFEQTEAFVERRNNFWGGQEKRQLMIIELGSRVVCAFEQSAPIGLFTLQLVPAQLHTSHSEDPSWPTTPDVLSAPEVEEA